MTLQPLNQEQTNRLKKIATIASISLAISLSLLKTFGALYTGSLAVLSSLIDSLADIFASSIVANIDVQSIQFGTQKAIDAINEDFKELVKNEIDTSASILTTKLRDGGIWL